MKKKPLPNTGKRKVEVLQKNPELKEIKGKQITVMGLGRSGVGAANLLSALGAHVTVTDIKTERELEDFIPRLNPSVKCVLGSHPEEIFDNTDMVVVSPGVPMDIQPLLIAQRKGIPIIGELELAYEITQGRVDILGITGTNGKSTTTALLDFMMKRGGARTILGGNIGQALTDELHRRIRNKRKIGIQEDDVLETVAADFIVAEISSFQLETIRKFRPKGAAIVNITPDHLDRYHSSEEYADAKARIFENQRENDFLVLNYDDPATMKIYHEKAGVMHTGFPRTFFFSRKEKVEGMYYKDGSVYVNFCESDSRFLDTKLIEAREIKIRGVHNLENAMAASAMALLAGCPEEAVVNSLRDFSGLEHRLEFVRELHGVQYFNDSKGTNVGAVIKSLESFVQPILLIAGGRDKAGDFAQLSRLVKERVKTLVLIGEASEKIKKALGDSTVTVLAKDLKDAIEISRNNAVNGDVVLLSPACASFDMFLDFEDRGRQFKKIVMEM
jgi:UDP-N-acetylmuramoylalanine--D-glutamate ligase